MAKILITTQADNTGRAEWLDFDDYSDLEEMTQAACDLFPDEESPEFLFEEGDDYPEEFFNGPGLPDEREFSLVKGYSDASSDDREMIEAFMRLRSEHWDDWDDLEKAARDAYQGEYRDWTEFAREFVDSLGYLDQMPENLRDYFDYEKFGGDLQHDYSEQDGHYFRD